MKRPMPNRSRAERWPAPLGGQTGFTQQLFHHRHQLGQAPST
jgi:hypothetical protein